MLMLVFFQCWGLFPPRGPTWGALAAPHFIGVGLISGLPSHERMIKHKTWKSRGAITT
jgi:hypothetical protein